MTSKEQAARQALKALEEIHVGNMTPMAEENWNKAIAALREALAKQTEQAPVAWWNGKETVWFEHELITDGSVGECKIPLYTAPVRTKDLTDDVCDEIIKMAEKACGVSTNGWDCLDPRFIVGAVIAAYKAKQQQ